MYPGLTARRLIVNATTLDAFLKEQQIAKVDLVKIDIEGGEPWALAGMSKLLSHARELSVIIEYHPECLLAAGVDPWQWLEVLDKTFTSCFIITPQGGLHGLNIPSLCRYMSGDYVNLLCKVIREQ